MQPHYVPGTLHNTSKSMDASWQHVGKITWWSSVLFNLELVVVVSFQCQTELNASVNW